MLQFRKRTKLDILYIYVFFPKRSYKKSYEKLYTCPLYILGKKYDKYIENNKNEDQGAKTLLKPNKGRNAYLQ